jgi:tetratricopeptide (TPR) repeat protein
MAKPGRNDRCPCGSGNKYKKCCLPKDEEAEHQRLAKANAERATAPRPSLRDVTAALAARFAAADNDDELTVASNDAADLVHAGKLDHAEQAARDLLIRFPDAHDGWDRLGMVHQARGDNRQAADCYRKVIDCIRANPDDYDPEFEEAFVSLVAKLDPIPPT